MPVLSASQALDSIIADMKAMKAQEAQESALSTNRPWVTAGTTKIKRDAPEHMAIEDDFPETFFSLSEQTLHGVAQVLKARRVRMEKGSHHTRAPKGDEELAKRREAALREVNVPPLEVAFLFGYTDPRPVRELRIRHGRNEHTGAPLSDTEKPIISDRKRARQ